MGKLHNAFVPAGLRQEGRSDAFSTPSPGSIHSAFIRDSFLQYGLKYNFAESWNLMIGEPHEVPHLSSCKLPGEGPLFHRRDVSLFLAEETHIPWWELNY